MTAARSLSALNAAQHKHLAKCIGLATTGTKAELRNLVLENLRSAKAFPTTSRIVSIDMGIRNLGICVLEAQSLTQPPFDTPTRLKIVAWKKVDVLGQLPTSTNLPPAVKSSARQSSQKPIDTSAFKPSILSRTACSITQDLLATYHPSHILIERQRFRSGGASAVQEWTLRVNMLESMIWASLETLRSVQNRALQGRAESMDGIPDAYEVSPARVAKFWCLESGEGNTIIDESIFLDPNRTQSCTRERKKIEKSDKISLARSWLMASEDDFRMADAVELDLTPEVRQTALTFTDASARTRKQGAESGGGKTKLDDLADCLLQGAAWVRWEENRRRLSQLLSHDEPT